MGPRPRKAQNAFKFYLNEMKKNSLGQDAGEITKIASKKWELMNEEEKGAYVELEKREKNKHESQLDES